MAAKGASNGIWRMGVMVGLFPLHYWGAAQLLWQKMGRETEYLLTRAILQFVLRRKKGKFKAASVLLWGNAFHKHDLERGGDRLDRWLEWNARFLSLVGRLRPHFASKLISSEVSGPLTNREAYPSSIADHTFPGNENWFHLLKAILLLDAKIEGESMPLFSFHKGRFIAYTPDREVFFRFCSHSHPSRLKVMPWGELGHSYSIYVAV
jgi:hypothetical protein